ncbi:MAG: DMT family transporter [Magnetococcales bacterium]|nr:DMT family transporter [Magnetococcales bacterium]
MSSIIVGIWLVIAAATLEGIAHICFKKSVLPRENRWLWMGLGVTFFACEAILYTFGLHWLDVSTAYTLGALTYVTTSLLSWWLLRERMDRRRWLGLVLIVVGCSLVAV